METEMTVNTFAADDVKKLEMRIAAADVRTKATPEGEIRVEAKNLQDGTYICEVRAGKLVISYEFEGVIHFHKFMHEEAQIMLYLPENLVLDHVVVEIGAGEVCMDAVPMTCRDVNVEVGAGKWKAAQLSVPGKLDVEVGAGKAKMIGITAGRVNIGCGVGSSHYKGRIDGDIKVSCGVGSCSFQLENKESDFNYDISCAVGSVSINNNRIKSFASKRVHKSETALGTAVLDCGLGSIDLQTNVIELKSAK